MTYLGVDPGTTGAFAVLHVHPDGTQTLTVTATPVVWVASVKGKRRRYEIPLLCTQLTALPPITLAYVEEQSARRGQGVTSMFSTGYGAGLWAGLLTAHGIPYVLIRPQRWRHLVGLPSYPKETQKQTIKSGVRLAACRRFPAQPISLDHADAVMLAVAAALEHGAEGRPTHAH